jgi:flavin reductase (DIM6/NTAB) family NADH-FMN oxidoreductase RutF
METFDAIAATLDYPMVVVTVADGNDRSGCLVGFSSQCSIDPARYAVCISKKNRTAEVASRAATMVVHLLREGDEPLARLFGEETGDEVSKFDECEWRAGPDGVPIVGGCDWFAGRVRDRVDTGDHVMHLLDVFDAAQAATGAQLGYQQVRDLEPGHAP